MQNTLGDLNNHLFAQLERLGDGNKRNFDPDNLILVSRAQLVRLNQGNLIQNDAELTRTGITIADIQNKIGERKKAKK